MLHIDFRLDISETDLQHALARRAQWTISSTCTANLRRSHISSELGRRITEGLKNFFLLAGFHIVGLWAPPPPPDPDKKRGGNAYSVLFRGIDRLLKPEQAKALTEALGGRRILSCNDRRCCPRGYEDTAADPKGHFLRQRAWSLQAIGQIPEPRRTQDFLDRTLAEADRTARQAAKLKVADMTLRNLLDENAKRLDRMRVVLENLHQTEVVTTRAKSFPSVTSLRHVQRESGR